MKKFRIVIADDHTLIREGIKTLITRNKNFTIVAEASTGVEAIEEYDKFSPDLLILDISMPQKNGMDTAEEILLNHPDANIIMLSMYDDEDYISRCIEIGVKGYVIKNESGIGCLFIVVCFSLGVLMFYVAPLPWKWAQYSG